MAATWNDLRDVPEGYVGEIVNGELVVHPRPGGPHAETASFLGVVVGQPFGFGRGGPGGWVIIDEPGVDFDGDIRVPDLAGWKKERYALPDEGPFTVTPEWLCEVLSPSTAVTDRTEKLPLYQRCGVRHVWLIDPLGFSLEVFRLEGDFFQLIQTARGNAVVRAQPFDAVELELSLLWGGRYEAERPSGEP